MAGVSSSLITQTINSELFPIKPKLDPQLRDVVKHLVDGVAKAIEYNNRQIDHDIANAINVRLRRL